jgi:hypothetical protein
MCRQLFGWAATRLSPAGSTLPFIGPFDDKEHAAGVFLAL